MTTILLDTHVVHWWAVEPDRVSEAAAKALSDADELAVAAVSWFELGWLINRGRVRVRTSARAWIEKLARDVRTVGLSPAIAATAADLPASFPRDPLDRLIFATAIEHGLALVSRDTAMHDHAPAPGLVIW